MSAQGPQSEVVLALAEEFLERYRQGDRPSLQEYADRHPDLADEIRDVLPALALLENIALSDSPAGAGAGSTTPPGPSPGPLRQLGDFRIIREVGHGGMGIVYEAEQVSLGRHVALKVLLEKMLLDPRRKRRFEREAKAAAKLHHTNIVPVFGVGEHDGLPYYAMQFIQGLGLDAVLQELSRWRALAQKSTLPSARREGGALPPHDPEAAGMARSLMTGEFRPASDAGEQANPKARGDATVEAPPVAGEPPPGTGDQGSPPALSLSSSVVLPGQSDATGKPGAKRLTYWQSVANIGVQVAEALEYAHRQGIRHRDIKPSNLLLDTHGTVWVTDFGLAKADDQEGLTQTGDIVGTLRYMPPEAFEGRDDARGDVYALGLTLYELLAFQPAFGEKDRAQLIKQVTTAEPARLGKVHSEVPRDLGTIVHKAIDREPGRRYQTAGALAADLERFLRGDPIRARRLSPAERLLRWSRRHAGLAAALAVLAVVLVGVSVASVLAALRFRAVAAEREAARESAEEAEAEARRRGDAERWERYRANITAAASALQLQNVDAAQRALEAAPAEHRNWEWRHLTSQLDPSRSVLRGHVRSVMVAVFSPDGKRLASAGEDCSLRLWEVATGKLLAVLQGHSERIQEIAFSPDGRSLASAADDRTLRLWDSATGRERAVLRGHANRVIGLAFSPDGRRLASCGEDSEVRLWNATTGEADAVLARSSGTTPPGSAACLAFSPDGSRLAARWDSLVRVWDTATGVEKVVLRGHTSRVMTVCFSPDGKRIVSGGEYPDNTVRLWDAATGQELAVLTGHSNTVKWVAFSPDGSRFASASMDQTARLWDGATGQPIATLRGHRGRLTQVAFSPKGTRLVTASEDHTLRQWDAATGELVAVLRGHAATVWRVAFRPDGGLLASASGDGTVRLWDAALLERNGVLRGHTNYVYDVAFSPDGERVASAAWDGTVRLWDATTGRQTGLLAHDVKEVISVAFSGDSKRLVTVSRQDKVHLWDVATGKQQQALEVPTNYWRLDPRAVLDPRGRLLAAGSKDGPVHLWDAATGQPVALLRGHEGATGDVAFSPDGEQLASGGEDGTVRLWDVATRAPLGVLGKHADVVYRIAYSRDGKLLASASEDHTVRLWDVRARQEVAVLPHGSVVYAVAFSPDGTRLAAGCQDNSIRLWDVATRTEVAELRGHEAYVHAVAFSPDGTRLVSASGDFTVRLWDTLPVQERARFDPPK